MTRLIFRGISRAACLGGAAVLLSCVTMEVAPPPPAADIQGRFNPDFVVDGQRYRLRGHVEYRTGEDGDRAHGIVRVRAHVEPWEARRGRFGVPSSEAGAELGYGVMPVGDQRLHFEGGSGTSTAGHSGIDSRLLECRVEASPPMNTKGEVLDVVVTAVVMVRPSGSGAEGQRDIEIRIPVRWRALNENGRAVLQPDPSNPASPFRW